MALLVRVQNNRGQAAIEAVVASMSLFLFCLLLLFVFYFCSLQSFLQFSSHEFLICREISEPFACDSKFRKELSSTLRFGRLDMLLARKVGARQQLHVRIRFSVTKDLGINWNYKDQIQFPLEDF